MTSNRKKNKDKSNDSRYQELVFTPEELQQRNQECINDFVPKKLHLKARTPNQKLLMKSIVDRSITICSGRPGSGKTFIALAQAMNQLIDKNTPYTKIYLFKSATTLEGEDIGFMPGDYEEKMYLPLLSYMLNLGELLSEDKIRALITRNIINIVPLAFARGISLSNSILIADEAQNISIGNMRTLMTRFSSTSKLIILGDENQKDIKNQKDSALTFLNKNFKDVNDDIGIIELTLEDVIRNPLIATIETVFDKYQHEESFNIKKTVING